MLTENFYQLQLNHADSMLTYIHIFHISQDAGTSKDLSYRNNEPHVIVLFIHTR
jgi:hypothetical protein